MAGRLSYDDARNTGIESTYTANVATSNRVPPARSALPVKRAQPKARSASLEPSRLRKPMAEPERQRAHSGQHLAPPSPQVQLFLQDYYQASDEAADTRRVEQTPRLSAGPPHSRNSSFDRPLPLTPTSGSGSRPVTPQYALSQGPSTASPATKLSMPAEKAAPQHAMPHNTSPTSKLVKAPEEKKKHGWFGKSRGGNQDRTPVAWVAGHPDRPAFDTASMAKGMPVAELWDDHNGSCYVYLFSRHSGKGPSFRVNPTMLAPSSVLMKLVSPPRPSSRINRQYSEEATQSETHMYLTLKLNDTSGASLSADDVQTLVDFRNLFAFLCGQSLVATEKRSSLFGIFVTIGSLLKAYEFSNSDGSTFGEVASTSFEHYSNELGFLDVRSSREKTIEGIVLGEKMRNQTLYTESFTHAVGKLDDILDLHSPKFDMISTITKDKLTRAALSLEKATQAVQLELKEFEFHSIFSGIMNSRTAEERKEGVRFDAWKEAVLNTRKWMLALLRQRYGAWPPKAKSKKNDLGVDGLQRQVIQELYNNMCSLYDLLVDKSQLTTRTVDGIDRAGPVEAPPVRALRSVLSEFDRSSPPVKPPVPFDLPIWPTLRSARKDFGTGDLARDAKQATKKLRDDEVAIILRSSYNHDATLTPFVSAFTDMERRASRGCTLQEIIDLRMGQWIFMYAVLQSLPLLACDAPGLRHTQGVEYFLSEPPRGYMPWVDAETAAQQKTWFAVNGATSMVSLPAHLLEHGVDGVYRRSHCWLMAERWTASNPLMNQALHEQEQLSSPDVAVHGDSRRPSLQAPKQPSRSPSPAGRLRNNSFTVGLEALTLPPGVVPRDTAAAARPRTAHTVDANKTFDAILGNMSGPKSKMK